MQTQLAERITQHQKKHLYRQRCQRDSTQLVFCNNDYLGMAQHPKVIAAAQEGIRLYGVSGSSSTLVAGYTKAHQALEHAFAKFLQRDAALLFSCGYMANLGVLSVLAGKKDAVFADKYIHASLIDAIRLSQAKLYRYRHLDYAHLDDVLAKTPASQKKIIVSDSVFSLQGDQVDVEQLACLAKKYQAELMIDDAHGVGVLGIRGAGISEWASQKKVPILMCPLAKAFGVMGAIVAGSSTLIDALVQFSRSYKYTNALPPALAVAGLVSLECVEQERWRRTKLQELIAHFRQYAQELQLPLAHSLTPIQSIVVGSSHKALSLSRRLLEKNILLNAMRPPTVPEKNACLRVTLTCLHEKNQINHLLETITSIYADIS